MLWKSFKIVPFLCGIASGIVTLMFVKTEKPTVLEYPHPEHVKDRVYRDKNGVCYSYTSKEVSCDQNEATLKPYPIQG